MSQQKAEQELSRYNFFLEQVAQVNKKDCGIWKVKVLEWAVCARIDVTLTAQDYDRVGEGLDILIKEDGVYRG